MSLDHFFRRYAELSLGPQTEALAKLYAPTFIAGGPQGSHAFTNDARFVEWLGQVADFNRGTACASFGSCLFTTSH